MILRCPSLCLQKCQFVFLLNSSYFSKYNRIQLYNLGQNIVDTMRAVETLWLIGFEDNIFYHVLCPNIYIFLTYSYEATISHVPTLKSVELVHIIKMPHARITMVHIDASVT